MFSRIAVKTYLIIILLIFICPCPTVIASDTDPQINQSAGLEEVAESTLGAYVSTTRDIMQIIFFLTLSTIGLLSYLQARKTLFTPLKTETFKLQLKTFEDILMYFGKHEDINIDDKYDYKKIFHLNSLRLRDCYLDHFFRDKIKVNKEKRGEAFKDLVGEVVTKKYAEENFEIVDNHIKKELKEPTPKADNPSIILANWQKYDHGLIGYTAKYFEETEKLKKFNTSPLLPKELRSLIEAFRSQVTQNLVLVGAILTEIAKELPEKYPTIENLQESEMHWAWNIYNRKRVQLKEKQNQILEYISKYLNVENLLK